MRPSHYFSILVLFLGLSTGLALFMLDYVWASRSAAVWIAVYYSFLILNEHENQE
jgi:cytochrome b subunit of formate dehydrogenase